MKRERDPNWHEGRSQKKIDEALFQNLAEKQKSGLMTVKECCQQLGSGEQHGMSESERWSDNEK